MDAQRQPGDAEAAAAARGMAEIYGQVLEDTYGRQFGVGDWITWARADWPRGRTSSGRVTGISGGVWLVEFDGDVASVSPAEVMPL